MTEPDMGNVFECGTKPHNTHETIPDMWDKSPHIWDKSPHIWDKTSGVGESSTYETKDTDVEQSKCYS